MELFLLFQGLYPFFAFVLLFDAFVILGKSSRHKMTYRQEQLFTENTASYQFIGMPYILPLGSNPARYFQLSIFGSFLRLEVFQKTEIMRGFFFYYFKVRKKVKLAPSSLLYTSVLRYKQVNCCMQLHLLYEYIFIS